jgi:2,5-furandicarboxylate decarboxylase 1
MDTNDRMDADQPITSAGPPPPVREGSPPRDLREFIEILREAGALHDIVREVDLDVELGAVIRACEREGRAAFFHRVRGCDQPVVGNVLGSRRQVALALGCDESEVYERLRRAPNEPIPPRIHDGPAPCKDVQREQVDLLSLPIPRHAPEDAGPFINASIVIGRSLDGGRQNLSYIRMQVYDAETIGFNINPWRDLDEFFRVAEERGENLPFCAAVGVDPFLMMGAAFRYQGDEYEVAGALAGQPIAVTPATTCDLLVPAHAEIILEGEVLAGHRRGEGPMAEFTGHYSGITDQPVARVAAITHRRDPIFQTIAGASAEHLLLGNALTREPVLESTVRRMSPRVEKVALPGAGFAALVSMKNPGPGEARSVAIAALSFHVNTKWVAVFDDDVDVDDPAEVMWALSTRVRWERDCIVIPGALGNRLDPASDQTGVQAKVIIDATLGPDRGEYQRVRYPPVNLPSYVGEALGVDASR